MIIISKSTLRPVGEFVADYMSRGRTNVIKGIFVMLVFFHHAESYLKLKGIFDKAYLTFQGHLNQMIVSVFLFYSGYGMMKSIQKKQFEYIRSIPFRRLFIVWMNFCIAVCLFLVMNLCFHKPPGLSDFLWSLIGWKSIGNSNWYMFSIFVLYIFMFLSFYWIRWLKKPVYYYLSTGILTVLIIALVWWEIHIGLQNWWYNTVILFCVGCWYALFEKEIKKIMQRNDYFYLGAVFLLVCVYSISYLHRWDSGIEHYTVWALAFIAMVVCITMKVEINSWLLQWLGGHVFSIYILQRIPMIIMKQLGFEKHRYFFMIMALAATLFLAVVFDALIGRLDKKILDFAEKWICRKDKCG